MAVRVVLAVSRRHHRDAVSVDEHGLGGQQCGGLRRVLFVLRVGGIIDESFHMQISGGGGNRAYSSDERRQKTIKNRTLSADPRTDLSDHATHRGAQISEDNSRLGGDTRGVR